MGGYRTSYDDDHTGMTSAPYWDWVHQIVTRYAASVAVGMWEPVSEPEASECPLRTDGPRCSGHQVCPDEAAAASALRSFFDAVGAEIKRLDPAHLVESGLLGSGQCGASGLDYASFNASSGIDVASVHDYGADDQALPGDQWNGEALRVRQMDALGKPLIVGELGIRAANEGGCASLGTRGEEIRAKVDGAFAVGIRGVLVWNWVPHVAPGCTFDFSWNDPLASALAAPTA